MVLFNSWENWPASAVLGRDPIPPSPGNNDPRREHALQVAFLLEEGEGTMVRGLRSGRVRNLSEALSSISEGRRQALRDRFGNELDHLVSLSREADPEFFSNGLYAVGRRLERRRESALAGQIYQIVRGEGANPSGIAAQAHDRLELFAGRGSFSGRAGMFVGELGHTMTDLSLIAAMPVGGIFYRGARFASLTRMVGAGRAGLGARGLASLAGLGAETLAFTATGKWVRSLMGSREDWSPLHFGQEAGETLVVLSGLRLAGLGTRSLYRAVYGNRMTAAAQAMMPVYETAGTYLGILGSHGLLAEVGLRDRMPLSALMAQSAGFLVHFKAGAYVARRLTNPYLGPLERSLDLRIQALEGNQRPMLEGLGTYHSRFHPRNLLKSLGPHGELVPADGPSLDLMSRAPEGEMGHILMRRTSVEVSRPAMGVPTGLKGSVTSPDLTRSQMELNLQRLMPEGRLDAERLKSDEYVGEILENFNISSNPLDIASFRSGLELARSHPNRVEEIAWDVDELSLHWSYGIRDLFRGLGKRSREGEFQNTPPELFNYEAFEAVPPKRTPWWGGLARFWFETVQQRFPMRIRQHLQFHPGNRAYYLAQRLGQTKNLTMLTTGPAGRVMMLANEDPAYKMIYFGRTPTQTVSIEDVRGGPNIYTREHLVEAARRTVGLRVGHAQDPLVRDYIRRVGENPSKGQKLKHPALARILGKRPFRILVDDSASTYDMLHDLENFVVIRPPSARKKPLLNFTLGSPQAYLTRMSNGYVEDLANLLATNPSDGLHSQALAHRPTPEGYVHQRFAIEIPHRRFYREFILPAFELGDLAREFRGLTLPEPGEYLVSPGHLDLRPGQEQALTHRLGEEIRLLTDGTGASWKIQTTRGSEIQAMAGRSSYEFQEFMDRYFIEMEQNMLGMEQGPFHERPLSFFSRIAARVSTKRTVADLLELDFNEHARDIAISNGFPVLRGGARNALGNSSLITTEAQEGNMGIGLAILMPEGTPRNLTSLGIHLATQAKGELPELSLDRNVLAQAAFKAAAPISRENFSPDQYGEYLELSNGLTFLNGEMGQAARDLQGGENRNGMVRVHPLSFQVGEATVGLVAIPAARADRFPRVLPIRQSSLDTDIARPVVREGRSAFPYVILENGKFSMSRPGMTITQLGDVGGNRTYQLAAQGHRVTCVEKDSLMIRYWRRVVDRRARADRQNGNLNRNLEIDWVKGDWLDTQTRADLVEAHFPLSLRDLPRSPHMSRVFIQGFMETGFHTKVKAGGSVFVTSELPNLMYTIRDIVRQDPNLDLQYFEKARSRRSNLSPVPFNGGYHDLHPEGLAHSWIVYRVKEPTRYDPIPGLD